MRVLATGCTGLLGSHFARKLDPRHELLALSRRPLPADLEGRARWIEHDLVNPLDEAALPESVDSVVHMAQSPRYRDWPEGAADVFEVNVAATFRLLDYARRAGASSFVLASTGGLYVPSAEPLREGDPIRPQSFYFRSKLLAEQMLEDYAEHFRTVALRPFFVYGPGSSRMLIGRLAAQVREAEPITVEGERGLMVNPVFVSDAARAFERAVDSEVAGVVNVAGPEPVTISALVELIAELTGGTPDVSHQGEEPGVLLGDIGRMSAELGAAPQVGLREGLAAMLERAPASGELGARRP